MTHDEINEQFSRSDTSDPCHVSTWHNPKNREARRAFVKAMKGRRYGFEPLLDAWVWFLDGWNAYGG